MNTNDTNTEGLTTYTFQVTFEDGNTKIFTVYAESLESALYDIEDAHQMTCKLSGVFVGPLNSPPVPERFQS